MKYTQRPFPRSLLRHTDQVFIMREFQLYPETDCYLLYFWLHRQNGLGYSSVMGRIGVSVSLVIMLLEEVWDHLPRIVFSLVAFTGGLSSCFLPETRNIRLPETIEDVEQTR